MKKQVIIIGGILIALVILISSLAAFTNVLAISGSSTLSISQANLVSNNPYFSGESFLLTFTSGKLGQSYFGSFSSSAISSLSDENVEKGFTLDVDYADQICNYNIVNPSRTPIFSDVKEEEWFCIGSNSLSRSQDNTDFLGILYYGKGVTNCWAIGYDSKSPVGSLSSPDLESEFTVKIDAGSESASKTFNTLSGSTNGAIGDFAHVVWQGNLVSGKSCPDKDPFIPTYINGRWRTSSLDAYNSYIRQLQDNPRNLPGDREFAVDELNRLSSNAKSFRTLGSMNSATSLNSASVEVKITDPIQFPITTVYIKSDTLGIFTPVPEINLFSATSGCFETGEQGSVEVGIENTGDERGIAKVFLQCESPFKPGRNIEVSLSPGESKIILLPLTAQADQDINGRCTIVAESTGKTDSRNVGVCVKPQVTCQANSQFCSTSGTSEVVRECSSNGATSKIIDTCSTKETCEDSECVSGDPDDDDNFFTKIKDFFSNLFKGVVNFFELLKYLITALAFVFTLTLSKKILVKFDAFEGNQTVEWIVSGIIALIVAIFLLAFLFAPIFWVVAIILGVFFFFQKRITDFVGKFRK